jgi:hypothetical protein
MGSHRSDKPLAEIGTIFESGRARCALAFAPRDGDRLKANFFQNSATQDSWCSGNRNDFRSRRNLFWMIPANEFSSKILYMVSEV